MNEHSFRQLLESIRAATDVPELIGEGVSLATVGSVLKGRSPFNADQDPSLVVWPHSNTWRDFSGGEIKGGDCFDWVMRRENCGFMDAVHTLARRAGIELPGADGDAMRTELELISQRRRIEDLLTAAAAHYHAVLPSKIRQTWYRERYGFRDETINDLALGWADGHLHEHFVQGLGIAEGEALSTGLFVRLQGGRVQDFFKDRLVFPYWKHGRVVYFIARATEHTGDEPWEQAKYKKLLTRSDRHAYVSPHVANDTFYNEDCVRGAQEVLITEGVTDCISAMQAGVPCISPVTVRFRKQDHEKLLCLTARARRIIICNDTEANGVGEAGAAETARALYDAGRDVRIATIPLPDGKEKIDVNELVATQGPGALRTVLDAGVRFPEFLIAAIPSDTPKTELAVALAPVIELLKGASPIDREAYLELAQKRFKLKAATIKELLRPSRTTGSASKSAGGREDGAEGRKGEVFEDTNHYYTLGRDGRPVSISSFQIEPRFRIVVEDGEIVDAEVTTDRGASHRVRFPRDAWHSKRNLLRSLGPVDMQWSGSDENVQGVLRIVASRTVPTRQGTRNLGYAETKAGPRWVTGQTILAPAGVEAASDDLVYVASGASLGDRLQYPSPPSAEEESVAALLLPNLLRLNVPGVILPIIGWFFAAPLKPRIAERLGHFPILVVWGTQGSGKSTLVMEVFWPMVGVVSSAPYSATETEFALLKLLSATNSIPVFIDEYKPFDMPRNRRNTLHRYMRRLYTGETEERGRADQTVVTYHLAAPLCLAGETRPIEPALVERVLTANPNKDQLQRDPQHAAAFAQTRTVNPGLLATSIVRFLLGRDTDVDLDAAIAITDRTLQGKELPFRVRDNLVVMVLGLLHFEEYAASMGVKLPDLDLDAAFEAVLADLLESGGSSVKTGLDYFLEELSVMAISGEIRHGKHYVYHEGLLALHFPACQAAYAEHCRRTGFEGEVPDRKALRRQLVENQQCDGYVRKLDELVFFNGRYDRRRATLIDIDEAKRILAVDDFPEGETSGSGQGGQEDRW